MYIASSVVANTKLDPFRDGALAFGAAAQRYVDRFPDQLSIIAAEPDAVPVVLAAAADRRRRGVPFYAAPLLDDPRAFVAQQLSGRILHAARSVDQRRSTFDALAHQRLTLDGGIAQTAVAGYDPTAVAILRDLVIMSDALLARSQADAQTVARLCGHPRRYNRIAPGNDATVPLVRAAGDAIVVWAPYVAAERLGVIAMGLALFRHEVIYVCAGGELPDVRGSFVGPDRGAEALARAACVVDATLSDPAPAIALARAGAPLVASQTAGVAEFLDGVVEYEPWNFRSVQSAVARALGAREPSVHANSAPFEMLVTTLAQTAPPVVPSEPLVSIVLATYGRPQLLEKALDSIAAQTYTTIETIVVNDGGPDLTPLCARYPFVRLIQLETNVGPSRASSIGMSHIQGSYFAFFADDDLYFPDHFARLVDALESSGAHVAHANTLTRYYSAGPTGAWQTRAYKVLHWLANDPIEMLTGPYMSFGSMLFRRSVIDEIGPIDPECGLVDVEYQARASERYDFIAVDAVTNQWNYSIEQKTYTHQVGQARFRASQEAIYAKYPSLLASVAARRADWLKVIDEKFHTVIWPPNAYLPATFTD